MTNTERTIAVRTPMSRTRPARARNSADSRSGRPNSLTRVAPGAEKRSVICVLIAALWSAASRSSRASRAPTRRAGSTNTGSSTSASAVSRQEMPIITARVRVRVTRLPTTPDRVSLKARWAPMTSLFSRLTSAPVRVRVKKATGMRCTWSKTAPRSRRISPSPMFADIHLVTRPSAASASAITAISPASPATRLTAAPVTIASITCPASTGVATASTAETTLSGRNQASGVRCGRAKAAMRRSVAAENGRRSRWAFTAPYSECQAAISMLITHHRAFRVSGFPRSWGETTGAVTARP